MKQIITTSQAPKAVATYSQAVEVNGTLFISGQVAIDPSTGKLIEGGIEEQTRQVMKNIGAILQAAGYDYGHLVKSTCILRDMADYAAMNAVYGSFYPKEPPARAAFAAAALPLGALVEIDAIAIIPNR
jgi:2-iminobutanoate/2-iminopropanoate deaminase